MARETDSLNNWMIYGANGYTGKRIAHMARRVGLRPVLAGRNGSEIQKLGKELGTPVKIFDLNDPANVERHLKDMKLVLHCAGPFTITALPMVNAAIATNTHYVDINGEIPALGHVHSKSEAAKEKGIMLLPGAGFDVVPTDCVAAKLHELLPDATSLQIAFLGLGGVSKGTLKSSVAQIGSGSKVRHNGELKTIPFFSLRKEISFDGEITTVHAIPWGDLFTAHVSTGIQNIEVYTSLSIPDWIAKILSSSNILQDIFQNKNVVSFFQSVIPFFVDGPNENDQRTGKTIVIGEVKNPSGKKASVRLDSKEGYTYTVESALAAVRRVLKDDIKPGFVTPSLAYGWRFALEVPGTEIREIS